MRYDELRMLQHQELILNNIIIGNLGQLISYRNKTLKYIISDDKNSMNAFMYYNELNKQIAMLLQLPNVSDISDDSQKLFPVAFENQSRELTELLMRQNEMYLAKLENFNH